MRRLARRILYLVLLLVALAAIAFFWRSGPFRQQLRSAIAQQLSRQTNRQVAISDLTFSLTGEAVLHDLVIKNRDGSPLLRAPEAVVRLGRPARLFSVASAVTALKAVTLRRPEIRIVRDTSLRWSIEDLVKRKPKGAPRFAGDVFVDQGRLTVVDQARGGITTALDRLDLSLRQAADGKVSFSVRAAGADGAFDSLALSGSSGPEHGGIEAEGSVSNLDLAYAFTRAPEIRALRISAGRGNIKGRVLRTSQTPRTSGSGFTVEAEVTDGEVAFPWLRRPVTSVKGTLRFLEGDLHLDGLAGTVAGAPITANGVVSGLKDPNLGIDVSVTGLRFQQLKQLIPKIYLPMTLVLPAPLRLTMRVEGPASAVSVEGRAEVRVIKFHLLPWHDLAFTFRYQQGHLQIRGLRAHGSPRRIEADMDVGWGKGKQTQATATFSLAEVPVSDFAEMLGLGAVDLQGIASVTGSASLEGGYSVTGRFTIRSAVMRGIPLGNMSGELTYSGESVVIRRGRVAGALGAGEFSGKFTLPDQYHLEVALCNLDLSMLGLALRQPALSGRFPVSARASGSLRGQRTAGWIKIGPGQLAGRALELLASDFDISPAAARFSRVALLLPHGAYRGELTVAGWQRRKGQAPISGLVTFREADPRDWLPPRYAGLIASGMVDGSGRIAGTIADPQVKLDVTLDQITTTASRPSGANALPQANGGSPPAGETGTESGYPQLAITGQAQVRYQGGSLSVDSLDLTESTTQLRLTGKALPTGLSLALAGDEVDLAPLAEQVRRRLGLDVTGRAAVRATITGPWIRPAVAFDLSTASATVNGLPFEAALAGRYAEGVLRLDTATLKQAQSVISASGTAELQVPGPGRINLAVDLTDLDLPTVQALTYQALWRLSESGLTLRRAAAYAAVPVGGRLGANIRVSGTLQEPQATVGLLLDDLSFGDRRIQRIKGDLAWWLRATDHRAVVLRRMEIRLQANHETASVYLDGGPATEVGPGQEDRKPGWVEPDGDMFLSMETRNLDLSLLTPWFSATSSVSDLAQGSPVAGNGPTGLGPLSHEDLRQLLRARPSPGAQGLRWGGRADINFDIQGPTRQPRLRGDVHIDDLHLGNRPPFETADANPITLTNGVLSIAGIRFGNHPMEAEGFVNVPLLNRSALPYGELHVRNGTFAPVREMTPIVFDADLQMLADTLSVSIAPAAGQPPGEAQTKGFSVKGQIEIRSLSLANLAESRFDVRAELNQAGLVIPGLVNGKLDGVLRLTNDPGPMLETDENAPMVLSHAELGMPRGRLTLAPLGLLPFAAGLRARVTVGEDVRFRYGGGSRPTDIRLEPGGYLAVEGPLTAAGIDVRGRVWSREGRLAFPNGSLTLRRGTAEVTREPGQPRPHIWISDVDVDGRIGDYYISLSPSGQIYPPAENGSSEGGGDAGAGELVASPFQWNANSIPALSEEEIKALLVGPVLAPVRTGSGSLADLLARPGAPSAASGEITGLAFPPLGSSFGLDELSLDLALHGPTRLRIGERLFRRVLVSYVSPLGGPTQSRNFRVIYEVTPRWSLAWGVDELDQAVWEVQVSRPLYRRGRSLGLGPR